MFQCNEHTVYVAIVLAIAVACYATHSAWPLIAILLLFAIGIGD